MRLSKNGYAGRNEGRRDQIWQSSDEAKIGYRITAEKKQYTKKDVDELADQKAKSTFLEKQTKMILSRRLK
ncbi:hypothetical protein ACEQPO_30070 [Bacillus sp. SL00103]